MKKRKIATLFLLSASLLTTSCSKISAELSDPNSPIVVDNSGSKVEVDNNDLKYIFDQIKNGSSYTSDVKNMLAELLANAYLGTFKVNSNGTVYIEELGENPSDSQVLSFVNDHQYYWDWLSTSTYVQYEESPNMSNIEVYKTAINDTIELVQKEIVKTLYNEAVTSSYMKNNRFYESLYAKSIYEKMYKIYNSNGSKINASLLYITPDYINEENRAEFENAGFTFGKLVTRDYNPDEDYKMIIEGDTQLLHLYHYVDYINGSILPTISSSLLTEAYIFNRQYQSIGRTQSRHLNFIKIADNDSGKAEELITAFVEEYLVKETNRNVDYTPLVEAWIGDHNQLNSDNSTLNSDIKNKAKSLADQIFGQEETTIDSNYVAYIDGKTGEDYPHYNGSLYGDIIDDYSKLTNNPLTNDTETYSSFTSIGDLPFSPEEGLAVKVEALKATSYVTNKWGGSSDFDLGDSSIVTNLFSYGLSTEFITATDPDTAYAVDGYYLKQFVPNGPAFLKKTSYSNPIDSIIWSNEGDYYLIEVVDQVSLSSLALDSDATLEEKEEIKSYAREIGYTVASGSTYTNNALTYFIEKSNINYHDQDVYDYFETNFPSLFE